MWNDHSSLRIDIENFDWAFWMHPDKHDNSRMHENMRCMFKVRFCATSSNTQKLNVVNKCAATERMNNLSNKKVFTCAYVRLCLTVLEKYQEKNVWGFAFNARQMKCEYVLYEFEFQWSENEIIFDAAFSYMKIKEPWWYQLLLDIFI